MIILAVKWAVDRQVSGSVFIVQRGDGGLDQVGSTVGGEK